MDYHNYFGTLKKIKFDLDFKKYIKMNKKNLDLVFIHFNKNISNIELDNILYLYSNGNYFNNLGYVNYNEIKNKINITNENIDIINVQMLYDCYDFLNIDNKLRYHIKFLFEYFCKVENIGGDFYTLNIYAYMKQINFNYVAYKITDNYYKYMLEKIVCAYRNIIVKDENYELISNTEKLIVNLKKLKFKYSLIKLAIFKVSINNNLLQDIFNIIFNLSLLNN